MKVEQANEHTNPTRVEHQMWLKEGCSAPWEGGGASDSSSQLQSTDRPPKGTAQTFDEFQQNLQICLFFISTFVWIQKEFFILSHKMLHSHVHAAGADTDRMNLTYFVPIWGKKLE